MNADRMKKLLQQAVPPMDAEAGPGRDLWPAILRRLDEQATQAHAGFNWAWFDGALAAGLTGLVLFFPASIPVILYYL
jgi:hypothetical protein